MKKLSRILAVMLCLTVCITLSASAVSKIGSVGGNVSEIQSKLKSMGYYSGNIDGIFGTATKNAVTAFQRDHELTPDGIVGKNTLKMLGLSENGTAGYSSSDLDLLARTVSAEARGESYLGQVAVAAVILNRIEHPSFPDTMAGVIYQNGAFSCLNDGQFYEPVADSAYKAARDALNGLDPSGGAIYYYNPAKSTNKWILGREVITTIGNHVFCG